MADPKAHNLEYVLGLTAFAAGSADIISFTRRIFARIFASAMSGNFALRIYHGRCRGNPANARPAASSSDNPYGNRNDVVVCSGNLMVRGVSSQRPRIVIAITNNLAKASSSWQPIPGASSFRLFIFQRGVHGWLFVAFNLKVVIVLPVAAAFAAFFTHLRSTEPQA